MKKCFMFIVTAAMLLCAPLTFVSCGDKDEEPTEQPGNGDDPGKDDPGKDDPGKDDPGKDDPGKDDPGKDDPGKDDPGKEIVYAKYAESDFLGNGKFTLQLSTASTADYGKTFTETGKLLVFEVFTQEDGTDRNTGLADGTYTYDSQKSRVEGTFCLIYETSGVFEIRKVVDEFIVNARPEQIKEGTLKVTHENGAMQVEVNITLQKETVEFTAKDFQMFGMSKASTTLTADKKLDLSKVKAGECYAFPDSETMIAWWIRLYPETGGADGLDMQVYSADEKTVPTGTFTEGVDGENIPGVAGKFRPGSYYPEIHQIYTTFIVEMDAKNYSFKGHAMVKTGSIKIAKLADGKNYSVDVDVKDENGHRITGSWSGPLEIK